MIKYALSRYLELALKSYGLPLWSIKGSTGAGCGVRLSVWGIGTPSLLTHQFQAKSCRGYRWVASIIERVDLGCDSNLMLAIISLTAPLLKMFTAWRFSIVSNLKRETRQWAKWVRPVFSLMTWAGLSQIHWKLYWKLTYLYWGCQ